MRWLTVMPPNTPAISTQLEKKIASGRCSGGGARIVHTSPAARKPL